MSWDICLSMKAHILSRINFVYCFTGCLVPSVDNVHDTSYFTSRQCWNAEETRLFADANYESSDYESSASGRSTSSSETRPEDSVSYK